MRRLEARFRRTLVAVVAAAAAVCAGLWAFSPPTAAPCAPGPASSALSTPCQAQAAPSPSPPFTEDEVAAFISGLDCSSEPLRRLQACAQYHEFAAAMDRSWAALEEGRLTPLQRWAEAELAEARRLPAVFYPFGGPDFLTAYELFPEAETYILLGLEFAGRLPDLGAAGESFVGSYGANVLAALSDFFSKSYFITHNMDAELTRDKVDGVLPLLSIFLKRTGHTIVAVKRVHLLAGGDTLEGPYPGRVPRLPRPYGIRIEYTRAGSTRLKSLLYFSCDLEDKAFAADSPLKLHLEGLDLRLTYVKSASYLMHYREFSGIRNLILAKSLFVLEDDTGIPYRFFPPKDWDVRLYGEYIKPVSDFAGVEQGDLKAAYAEPGRALPLPFHLGYHWGTNKDSLLLAVRKTVPAKGAPHD